MTYVLSNIPCASTIPNLEPERDELVFLNKAVNWETFKDIQCLKYLYCRTIDTGGYFVRPEWEGKEMQFFNRFEVLGMTGWRFPYTEGKTPTTGFWVWNLLKEQGKDVVLVNFLPHADFTTSHWEGHDWKYEGEVYERVQPKMLVMI